MLAKLSKNKQKKTNKASKGTRVGRVVAQTWEFRFVYCRVRR